MPDDDQIDEAGEHAQRAGRHVKDAATETVRAVQKGTGAAVEVAADELRETADKLEGTAEDAVAAVKRVDPRVLSRISSDAGQGFMMLSVALWAGTVAYNKFRGVYAGRKAIVTS